VLGALRAGYRSLQLRHPKFGTRIELCGLLLHISFGEEPNLDDVEVLKSELEQSQAANEQKDKQIRALRSKVADLEASLADQRAHSGGGGCGGGVGGSGAQATASRAVGLLTRRESSLETPSATGKLRSTVGAMRAIARRACGTSVADPRSTDLRATDARATDARHTESRHTEAGQTEARALATAKDARTTTEAHSTDAMLRGLRDGGLRPPSEKRAAFAPSLAHMASTIAEGGGDEGGGEDGGEVGGDDKRGGSSGGGEGGGGSWSDGLARPGELQVEDGAANGAGAALGAGGCETPPRPVKGDHLHASWT